MDAITIGRLDRAPAMGYGSDHSQTSGSAHTLSLSGHQP